MEFYSKNIDIDKDGFIGEDDLTSFIQQLQIIFRVKI